MVRRTAITIVIVMATLLGFAGAALDPTGPNLRFNMTLSTVDVPVRLSPPSGWQQTSSVPFPNQDVVPSAGMMSVIVTFAGDGFAVHGDSPDAWTKVDPNPQTRLYLTGDVGFPSGERLNASESAETIVSHVADRFKDYEATLALGDGNWTVKGVTIMTGMQTDAPSIDAVRIQVEPFVKSTAGALAASDYFNLTGRWEPTPADDVLPERLMCYDSAKMSCPVPANTSYVVINGTRGPASNNFNIAFATPSDPLNGYAIPWTVYPSRVPAMLYMTPLDPTVRYTIAFGCVSSGLGENGLSSVTFYSAFTDGTAGGSNVGTGNGGDSGDGNGTGTTGDDSGSGSSGRKALNVGEIVGIVVAGIALVGLLFCLIYRCQRPRRMSKTNQADVGHGQYGRDPAILDDPDVEFVTPFPPRSTTPATPVSISSQEKHITAHNTPFAGIVGGDRLQSRLGRFAGPSGATHHPHQSQAPGPSASHRPTRFPEAGPAPAQAEPVHAEDGGTAVNLLPPMYDPRWVERSGRAEDSGDQRGRGKVLGSGLYPTR